VVRIESWVHAPSTWSDCGVANWLAPASVGRCAGLRGWGL